MGLSVFIEREALLSSFQHAPLFLVNRFAGRGGPYTPRATAAFTCLDTAAAFLKVGLATPALC